MIDIRRIEPQDVEKLEEWRTEFPHHDLDLPHGYARDGVGTLVVTDDDQPKASMTGVAAVVIDPYLHDPSLTPRQGHDYLLMLEAFHRGAAQRAGMAEIYIAVVDIPEMAAFHKMVQREGYEPTAQGCVIYRRKVDSVNSNLP